MRQADRVKQTTPFPFRFLGVWSVHKHTHNEAAPYERS